MKHATLKSIFKKVIIAASFIFLVSGTLMLMPVKSAYGAASLQFTPEIPIPGTSGGRGIEGTMNVGTEVDGVMTSDLLSKYIKAIYDYGLAVTGILAAIILMGAGLLWLTSGGNESKVTQAKDMIAGSLTGMILLFGAWMVLNTVNPELLKLRPIALTRLDVPEDADYIITNLKDAPGDIKYGWICMNNENQRCEDNDPPSINLSTSICRDGHPENAEPSASDCQYNLKKCCGQSEITKQTSDSACKGHPDNTRCVLNKTAVENGYCYQEKCINKLVCCQCGQGEVAGVYVYVTCKNDVTFSECSSWCLNGWVGSAYKTYVGGSSAYSCAGGAMSYCQNK